MPRLYNGLWINTGGTSNSGFALRDQFSNEIIFHYSNSHKQLHLNAVGYIGLQKVSARGKDDTFNCIYSLTSYKYTPSFGIWQHSLVYEIDAKAKNLSFSCGILYSS